MAPVTTPSVATSTAVRAAFSRDSRHAHRSTAQPWHTAAGCDCDDTDTTTATEETART